MPFDFHIDKDGTLHWPGHGCQPASDEEKAMWQRIATLETAIKLALAADALDTCQPGDYTTGHVCHPYFDEAKVDAAIKALKAEGDDPKF